MNITSSGLVMLAATFALASALAAGRMDDVAAKGHPRLFADGARFELLREQAKGDNLRALAVKRVVERAKMLVDVPPLERKMVGRRLLVTSRNALYRISTLAMAWKVDGERRLLDRAVAELEAVCAFSDWNPSHFLDVAEMSLAVSIGYDWLYNDISEEAREKIRSALREKGLVPGFNGGWWVTARNNWGQVCRAGLIAVALSLADDPAMRGDCERMLAESIKALPISMKAMAPDGCYPEGPGYWHYGVSFNVFAIAMLESACGTDFGLSSLPGFWETAEFPNAVTSPTGLTVSYSDSGSARPACGVLWWFAQKLGRPDLLTEKEVSAWTCQPKRMLSGWLPPVELFWMDERKPGVVPSRLPSVWAPRSLNPVVVLRAGKGENEAFAGLKGGTPSANHGHMDGGNFVLDMGGVRWAMELPSENYTSIEAMKTIDLWAMSQGSSRWSLLRLNADGHNVPQIDGKQQLVAGRAEVVSATNDPNPRVVMDLTSLYKSDATKVMRSFVLSADGSQFSVCDEFEGLRPGAEVTWKFITKAKAVVSGDKVVLAEGGRGLEVEKETSAAAEWSVVPAEGPRPPNSPNKGCNFVRYTMKADARGRASSTVEFRLK